MGEWRWIIADLRREIDKASALNINSWKLQDLKYWLDDQEANYAMRHEREILDKINNPHREYDKAIDSLIKYQKEANAAQIQYTQLVITAGYATYFGLWSIAKDQLGIWPSNITFLLIAISAIAFIIVEVVKIGIVGFGIHIKNQALIKAKIEDNIKDKEAAVASLNKYDTILTLILSRVWVWTYPTSVITGLAAIFILIGSLTYNVIDGAPWDQLYDSLCSFSTVISSKLRLMISSG